MFKGSVLFLLFVVFVSVVSISVLCARVFRFGCAPTSAPSVVIWYTSPVVTYSTVLSFAHRVQVSSPKQQQQQQRLRMQRKSQSPCRIQTQAQVSEEQKLFLGREKKVSRV
jgi:uncharacterized protein YfaS (alpha-2-macroglobulin family)